jgi:hypothetical protein
MVHMPSRTTLYSRGVKTIAPSRFRLPPASASPPRRQCERDFIVCILLHIVICGTLAVNTTMKINWTVYTGFDNCYILRSYVAPSSCSFIKYVSCYRNILIWIHISVEHYNHIVTCWLIATQRLGKHIPATTNTQVTIGQLRLPCSGAVNTIEEAVFSMDPSRDYIL